MKVREVKSVHKSKPTIEGAGVHLKRVFSNEKMYELDPFLLMDDFHSNDRDKYIQGFPWHPHRGIETITYMLEGQVSHEDSLGNAGVINPGDVQWMTAGSGIIHQEMPSGDEQGNLWGFQLWANLPSKSKMMQPRYRDITMKDFPLIKLESGVEVKIISGKYNNVSGPVDDVVIDPQYLDVSLPANTRFEHQLPDGYTAFAYTVAGNILFDQSREPNTVGAENLVIFGPEGQIEAKAGDQSARFLLISGKPIGEPIAWHGPIIMNTQGEIKLALQEYRDGTFLKHD